MLAHDAIAVTSSPPTAEAFALDEAIWWMPRALEEPFPRDRLWACFSCASCSARWARTFRSEVSPWTGGASAPLYRDLPELVQALERLATARTPDGVDALGWKAATSCSCHAPSHRTAVIATGLFHLASGGTGLVVLRHADGGATRAYTIALGEGALRPIEATDAGIEAALGRSLTLAGAWQALLARLPVPDGQVVGSEVEDGAFVLAARDADTLHAAASMRLDDAPHVIVRVDPSTIESRAWPASLAPLADRIREGAVVALVLAKDALRRRLRATARARIGADVQEVDGELRLATAEFAWPLSEVAVAQTMVQLGRTLPEACALMIAMAKAAGDDRLATLRAMVQLVPGTFEVDGTRATGVRSDGSRGRTIELSAIPAYASALPSEGLVREAAFLLDAAPEWADRARICPCGAAATVERRLVSWPWRGEPEAEPFVLETFREGEGEGAAVVVALCCDRHVRVPGKGEVERLGLHGARLEARLACDAPDARVRAKARTFPRHAERAELVMIEGAQLSGVVLDDGRIRALYDALAAPLGDAPRLVAWAVDTDRVALVDPRVTDDARALEVLRAMGADRAGFVVRREVDLSVEPVGTFTLTRERG